MQQKEGLPVIKMMMLLSSMAPLFLLIGLRGIDKKIVCDEFLWIGISILVVIPLLFTCIRIFSAKRSKDILNVDITQSSNNKDYLFTYLFTVLLPLYSFTIASDRDAFALLFALLVVIFVLWNMNLHFINFFFAMQGYKVYTLDSVEGAILLSTRHTLPKKKDLLSVHRLSNSVFIELKGYNYGS
ncbi:MAG: hypothetical protein EOO46_00295 [Flavobacterium sp.]|nr:MAG: hypothetical protein EOO46_00295 [Flavobacterium sp.]